MRPSPLVLALVVLAAVPAAAEFNDGVFTSAEHGVRFKLPKEYTVDTGNTEDGRVALFQGASGETKGVLRHVKEGLGAAKHAKWRGAEWEKKGAVVTWVSEEKLAGKEGDWLKVVLELEAGEEELKSAHMFVSKGKDDYELGVMVKAADWEKAEKEIDGILASLEFGEFKEEPASGGGEVLLPNPWEGCGKGSWVKYRMVTESADSKTEVVTTTTLVDFDAETYTIKTDMVMGQVEMPGPEEKVSRRQKGSGNVSGKTEEGDEKLKVAKGEFSCHWTKTTMDSGWSKAWSSPEVPGMTVKVTTESTGLKTEMELLDFERK